MADFDAIVVGSGMSGGWAAKELCERGLKVLVLERGRQIDPAKDYTDSLQPWERPDLDRVPEDELERDYPIQKFSKVVRQTTKHLWLKDHEHPYETPPDRPFHWIRAYHVGGRSIMWGRYSFRLGPQDFEANAKDGHGVDWPIRYADVARWYDHVERFAGISGTRENIPHLPDGEFLPPFDLTPAELAFKRRIESRWPTRKAIVARTAHLRRATDEQMRLGRAPCQVRNLCDRGCSYGAYFSSLSATLPAAAATGNLTLVPNANVQALDYDPKTRRVTGVRVVDAETRQGRTYTGRMVFLCASAIPSAMILLNSRSEAFPNGLANSSDQVGRNVMDHVGGANVWGEMPGFEDQYHYGRRPTGFYMPTFANVTERDKPYTRGFNVYGWGVRGAWRANAGVGAALKEANRTPGPWQISMIAYGEVLPNPNNRVTLHPTKTDRWGMPLPFIDVAYGANEHRIMSDASRELLAMAKAAGLQNILSSEDRPMQLTAPGAIIHEMGTARMGRDPATSVLNGWNQAHEVANLFITDGACMTSSATQNPSLTYMMFSARAANHAADLLRDGLI